MKTPLHPQAAEARLTELGHPLPSRGREAAIAAEHAFAPSFEVVRWGTIVSLYEHSTGSTHRLCPHSTRPSRSRLRWNARFPSGASQR